MAVTRRRTMLLIPWGNGLGHLTRCLALGQAAQGRGWRAVVAIPPEAVHDHLVRDSGCEPQPYPRELIPTDPWRCWADTAFVRAAVEADVTMIRQTGAGVVVHDNRPATPVACRLGGVPCATICQRVNCVGFVYPGQPGPGPTWVNSLPAFNIVLESLGLPLVRDDLRELYLTDAVIIPSIPEFDPLPATFPSGAARYVGPFIWRPSAITEAPLAVGTGHRARDAVFVYGALNDPSQAADFTAAFADLGDRVIIAAGSESAAARWRLALGDAPFQLHTLLDMEAMLPATVVAIIHGGHGICLSCLRAGVPAVAIPGTHPERHLNGAQLASLGAGVSLAPEYAAASPGLAGPAAEERPSWQQVRAAADQLVADETVRQRVDAWHQRLVDCGGTAAAMDVLEAL